MIKKNSIIGDIIEQIRESKSSESGMFGDEIGLPIDAEEGTDASAVSTPTGVVGDSEGIVCPKCGSHDVNIHNNGNDFYCVECGDTWPVQDSNADGVDDDEEPVKESSVDLEVGKAYKTDKGVQFEVRKIDKRGTATVYDFDQGAEYKVTKKQLAKLKVEEIHEGRTGFRKTMDSIIDSFCD